MHIAMTIPYNFYKAIHVFRFVDTKDVTDKPAKQHRGESELDRPVIAHDITGIQRPSTHIGRSGVKPADTPYAQDRGQTDTGPDIVGEGDGLSRHPCAMHPCRGGGVCHAAGGQRYTCTCKKGRHGPNCECE